MTDEEWTVEEQERLRGARVDRPPPPALEDTVVRALGERGLLRRPRRGLVAALLAVAAALVAAVGWAVVHRTTAPAPGPRFVLLLYAGADPIAGEADARRREYSEWARGIAATGVTISGEELADEARQLPRTGSPEVPPLPRGFFVLGVPDLDAAERIAATCPHLRYGGRVVVKRIVG